MRFDDYVIEQHQIDCLDKFGYCCHNLPVTKELPAKKMVGATLVFYLEAERCSSQYYQLRIVSEQKNKADPKSRDVVLATTLEQHHLPAPG